MISAFVALAMCSVAHNSVQSDYMPSLLHPVCTSHVYPAMCICIAAFALSDLSPLSDHVFLYTVFEV